MFKAQDFVVVAMYAQAHVIEINGDKATVQIVGGAQKTVPTSWLRAA